MELRDWAQQMSVEDTVALRRKVAAVNMAADQDLQPSAMPNKRYLICSTQRSGSTLLANLLDQTGVAGRPMEYFNNIYIQAFCERLGVSGLTHPQYLQKLQSLRRTPNGVFGAKGHLWQLQVWLGTEEIPALQKLLAGFDHLIFLKRRSSLNQAISLDRAVQTGHWSSQHAKLAEGPASSPVFDALKIIDALKFVLIWERQWQNVFLTLGLKPIEIYYEDIIEDPTAKIHEVLAHLGIEPALGTQARPALAAQADRYNQEFREKFLSLLSG